MTTTTAPRTLKLTPAMRRHVITAVRHADGIVDTSKMKRDMFDRMQALGCFTPFEGHPTAASGWQVSDDARHTVADEAQRQHWDAANAAHQAEQGIARPGPGEAIDFARVRVGDEIDFETRYNGWGTPRAACSGTVVAKTAKTITVQGRHNRFRLRRDDWYARNVRLAGQPQPAPAETSPAPAVEPAPAETATPAPAPAEVPAEAGPQVSETEMARERLSAPAGWGIVAVGLRTTRHYGTEGPRGFVCECGAAAPTLEALAARHRRSARVAPAAWVLAAPDAAAVDWDEVRQATPAAAPAPVVEPGPAEEAAPAAESSPALAVAGPQPEAAAEGGEGSPAAAEESPAGAEVAAPVRLTPRVKLLGGGFYVRPEGGERVLGWVEPVAGLWRGVVAVEGVAGGRRLAGTFATAEAGAAGVWGAVAG